MTDTKVIVVFVMGWICSNLWTRLMRASRELEPQDMTEWEEDNRGYNP
jgi:hypothetical protein